MKINTANNNPKRIKRLLLLVIIVGLSALIALFIGYRRIMDQNDGIIAAIKNNAGISMDRVQHVATKDGKEQWRLQAKSAHYLGEKNQVILNGLSVVFFMENDTEVHLTANTGILQTESNDMEASGNVVVIHEGYRMNTEKLIYRHAERRIFSKTPVALSGNSFHLTAQSMSFDMNTKKTVLQGRVKGSLNEKLSL